MPFFTSSREKHIWTLAFAVFVAIYSTLFFGQPLARLFSNQDLQAAIFLLAMVLVAAAIIAHGLMTKPGKIEITILLGIVAVYIMFFLRLGLPERTHLIEYSILAIFIYKAINERICQGSQIRMPALLSFVVAFLIGVFDESIQLFLPDRVFDPVDILFNGVAVAMAIVSSILLTKTRKLITKVSK